MYKNIPLTSCAKATEDKYGKDIQQLYLSATAEERRAGSNHNKGPIMNVFTVIWATFSLVFVILEIGHPSLLFYLPLSIACLAAALAAYYEYLFINQMTVFFFSSAIAIWLFKKFLKKMHGFHYRTNVDALIGKYAVVTAAIYSDAPGYIKVQGEYWLARSSHACLPVDSKVHIVGVRGAHVIVEPHN